MESFGLDGFVVVLPEQQHGQPPGADNRNAGILASVLSATESNHAVHKCLQLVNSRMESLLNSESRQLQRQFSRLASNALSSHSSGPSSLMCCSCKSDVNRADISVDTGSPVACSESACQTNPDSAACATDVDALARAKKELLRSEEENQCLKEQLKNLACEVRKRETALCDANAQINELKSQAVAFEVQMDTYRVDFDAERRDKLFYQQRLNEFQTNAEPDA